MTSIRSPVVLKRRSMPDTGAAGCMLDTLGGLKTTNCQGDTRDTAYRLGLPLFALEEDEVAYAVGVNHGRVGTSVYSNIALYDLQRKTGVTDFSDQAMVGSVNHLLLQDISNEVLHQSICEGHKDCDDLFAVRIAFDCAGNEFCITIPMAPGTPMALVERAYVNERSGVGPDEASMVMMELVIFKRNYPVPPPFYLRADLEAHTYMQVLWRCMSAWYRVIRAVHLRIHAKLYLGALIDALKETDGKAQKLAPILAFVTLVGIRRLLNRKSKNPKSKRD
jgi:hypothetical protein